ncbi:MAG: hypothetical protein MUF54_14140 [Polyangiaceae bacterium]|nr:hypothetical protein [Polyangiaceae bacterium]
MLSQIFKKPPDYGMLLAMRQQLVRVLEASGAERRDLRRDFAGHARRLPLPLPLVFGTRKLKIHFDSYQSKSLAVASYSQFEAPPESGSFTDFAFQLRPVSQVTAPLLHGEALRPMPGNRGMFTADLYNTSPGWLDLTSFVEERCPAWLQAIEIVKPFQKTKAQGRGKFTRHLEPYKSPYRIELAEPRVDSGEHKPYFEAVGKAFEAIIRGYLDALDRMPETMDPKPIASNEQGFDRFFDTLCRKDFAVKMGRFLLKRDFDAYFHQGFWGAALPVPGRASQEGGQCI